jgi:hypothetical protein
MLKHGRAGMLSYHTKNAQTINRADRPILFVTRCTNGSHGTVSSPLSSTISFDPIRMLGEFIDATTVGRFDVVRLRSDFAKHMLTRRVFPPMFVNNLSTRSL